jgi:hypothetical protein
VLLALMTIAIAEAALAAVLVVFSYVLKIDLSVGLGLLGAVYSSGPNAGPIVQIFGPAVVGAVLFTAACGLATATWTFRHWERES